MRIFLATLFLALLMLCYKSTVQGAIITIDVSQHPITFSANKISTWEKDADRIFLAEDDVKIEQGDILITANYATTWFTEVKIDQQVEGHMDIYCEGNVALFQEGVVQNYEQMYLRLVTSAGVAANSLAIPIQNFEEEQRIDLYLRGERVRFEGKGEFASKETPKAVPSTSMSIEGEPIDIFADDLDTWVEKDVRVVVATGNVRVKRGEDTLNAENIILYFGQEKDQEDKSSKLVYKEVYAEGNVTMRRGKDVVIADKIFENVQEDKGLFVNSVFRSTVPEMEIPIYIRGDQIKHKGNDQYEVENGFFSTCSFGHPHFRFQSSNIRVFRTGDDTIIAARKNTFYAGDVPIMYLPFMSFDVSKKSSSLLKDWEMGRTSRYGQFIKTDWDVYSVAFGEQMDDWSDLTLSVDYLGERGPAVGVDFDYAKSNFFGFLNTYYINDRDDFDINSVPVDDNNRGHILWRHRQILKGGWRVDAEISHVSDRNYFSEFFNYELKTEKDRETILYLRKIYDNRAITFLAEKQIRSYDTLVDSERLNRTNETLPELKYRMIGEPVWENRLNFTSETELAYHDRIFDGISPKRAETEFLGRGDLLTAERVFDRVPVRLEPEETFRFDTDNTLNAPFNLMGVRFNPYMGARLTGYSESVDTDPITQENDGGGTPRGRLAASFGLNTNTTLSRTYSFYNKFLNINRLRHVMVPEARFSFIPLVTQDPEDLNQFDRTDALDTYSAITLGLRNKLQTMRGEPGKEIPMDFFDFDLEFNFFPGDAGLNRRRDEYVNLDLRLRLTDKLTFLSERNEFNLRNGAVDTANVGITYSNYPDYAFYLGTRYIDDTSSSVIFSTDFYLSEKWRVMFFEQYDFKSLQSGAIAGIDFDYESQNLYTRFVLSRLFHDWIGNLTIERDDVRADTITRFDIIPRGSQNANNRFWFF